MLVPEIQDVRTTGVHVAVTVQPHLVSNEGINCKTPSGECWLTEGVSFIHNVLVHTDHIPTKECCVLSRLTCDCRGSSHDGKEGQDGKAKAVPSSEDGHHDRLSCCTARSVVCT